MSAFDKLILAACLSFLSVMDCDAQSTAVDSSYMNSHYDLRLDFFRKMPDKKREIVFLGNSLTEGGKWQELIRNKHVINRGISGDVSYGLLARLDEVLSSKPAKIFLLCGINDMKRGTSDDLILSNIRKIADRVKSQSPHTKLLIQSLLPVNESMLPASYSNINNAKIDEFNHRLDSMCLQIDVNYIDLHPVFEDQEGSLRKELCIDGLHLRQASYILWSNYLIKLGLLN